MSEIINKLSSYNIFNYLFTGIVFIILSKILLDMDIYIKLNERESNVVIDIFWAYFVGLTISRIGSLIIEPLFKKIIKTKSYSKFIKVEKIDSKLSLLSEQNNIYRTLIALFFTLLVLYFIKFKLQYNGTLLIIISLFLIYSVSYLKQTKYIVKRIETILKQGDNDGNC